MICLKKKQCVYFNQKHFITKKKTATKTAVIATALGYIREWSLRIGTARGIGGNARVGASVSHSRFPAEF